MKIQDIRAAYATFCHRSGFKTPWEHLPETWQQGFAEAFTTAVDSYVDDTLNQRLCEKHDEPLQCASCLQEELVATAKADGLMITSVAGGAQ